VGEHRPSFYKVGDLVTGKVTKLASFGAFIGLQHEIDGLVHISQISEERVDKIKNVLKVGQEVTARVIKIDKGERRIGLSIKAASYSDEQLKEEQKMLDALKPGEDLVALQHAFDASFFEPLEILRQMPRDFAVRANHAVQRHRGNGFEVFHVAVRRLCRLAQI
jgi:predicted RNA-binding protein with RPS1 domain